MKVEAITQLIQLQLPDSQVQVDGDGHHFQVVVISNEFIEKNSLQRQQLVYKALHTNIATGELHAISLKTYTPTEWEVKKRPLT